MKFAKSNNRNFNFDIVPGSNERKTAESGSPDDESGVRGKFALRLWGMMTKNDAKEGRRRGMREERAGRPYFDKF